VSIYWNNTITTDLSSKRSVSAIFPGKGIRFDYQIFSIYSHKYFYIFSFNMRILGNFVVFFISLMGMILADNDDRKWFYNDTQLEYWNKKIRNT